MDEQLLRALVRDAVTRHLGGSVAPSQSTSADPSHFRYPVTNGLESGGPCLIEPAVTCNQCGYCQSHGH